MASASSNTANKKNTSLPPKRGQIKARSFENLAQSVVSLVSMVGDALGWIRGEGGSGRNSASSTPPPSAYNSDENSEIS